MEPTIKQLRYFVAVAEAASFRGAAAKLGISQPTLTAQVAALERIFDGTLLERTRRGVALSPLGRTLLPHMQAVLSETRAMLHITQDASRTPSGTHRLGVPPTLGPYFLPEVIPAIHREFPSLRIFVKEDTPRQLEQGLHDGTYDLILSPLPLERSDCAHQPLFAEPLHVVAAPDHPLANHQNIQPHQFIGDNFLVIEDKHHFSRHVQRLAAQYGFQLLRDFEGTSLDTLRQMIGTGLGLSFLPALYIRSEIAPRQDVTVLDIGFELPTREIALAWRQRSPQKHLYQQITKIMRSVCRTQLQQHVRLLGESGDTK